KTKYMVIGGQGEDLDLGDTVINNEDKFVYLGTTFTERGGSTEEIKKRMGQTKAAIKQLHPIIWSNKLTIKTKKMIYSTFIQSIATYGAEIWELTQRNSEIINATEMEFWRRSCGK